MMEERNTLYKDIVQSEKSLEQLHADIYQRREEARKIRISLRNGEPIEKLLPRQKSLHTHIHHDMDRFLSRSAPPPSPYPWCLLLVLGVLSVLVVVLVVKK